MRWAKHIRMDGALEYDCPHGIGHSLQPHCCDDCCLRGDFPLNPHPAINYCVHELDSGIPELLQKQRTVTITHREGKNAGAKEKYDLTADYIITDTKRALWGIERKTLFDMYTSRIHIEKGGEPRLLRQARQLREKYGHNAIIMLEATLPDVESIRKALASTIKDKPTAEIEAIIARGAFTMLSKFSFAGYRIIAACSPKHAADLLLKIARSEMALQ